MVADTTTNRSAPRIRHMWKLVGTQRVRRGTSPCGDLFVDPVAQAADSPTRRNSRRPSATGTFSLVFVRSPERAPVHRGSAHDGSVLFILRCGGEPVGSVLRLVRKPCWCAHGGSAERRPRSWRLGDRTTDWAERRCGRTAAEGLVDQSRRVSRGPAAGVSLRRGRHRQPLETRPVGAGSLRGPDRAATRSLGAPTRREHSPDPTTARRPSLVGGRCGGGRSRRHRGVREFARLDLRCRRARRPVGRDVPAARCSAHRDIPELQRAFDRRPKPNSFPNRAGLTGSVQWRSRLDDAHLSTRLQRPVGCVPRRSNYS